MRTLLVGALVAVAAHHHGVDAQPRFAIQTCTEGMVGESFHFNISSSENLFGNPLTIAQLPLSSNQCIDYDSSSLLLATCDNSANQAWIFRLDGTVQSVGESTLCWNAFGGSTSPGTSIVLYSCGSRRSPSPSGVAVAANDVFWPLANSLILANESSLCVSSAQPPPPPCSDFTCCQLNGRYNPSTQTCTCYPPWVGANCSTMNVLPVQAFPSGYGVSPNLTSWGGNIVPYENQYYLVVAEMMNDCPLNTWGSNSHCIAAVSDSPNGPFTKVSEAVGVWCHNPQVVPFMNNSQQMFALFHIGTGGGGSPKNCTPPAADDEGVMVVDTAASTSITNPNAAGSTLHLATNPAGPYTPVASQPPGCNNPSPLLHTNGTWFLLCDSRTLYSSPTLFGPWIHVTDLNPSGGVAGTYEDAFLYLDNGGNWHVIFHVYTTNVPSSCVNSTVSGHFFSPDGLNWMASPTAPFGNLIEFTDGTSMTVSTRERPKLLFNSAGVPTHLINGVCGGSSYCGNEGTPCVNCKYNYWDFTLVQPLNTGA